MKLLQLMCNSNVPGAMYCMYIRDARVYKYEEVKIVLPNKQKICY